jgi:hypothetical protein
MHHRNTKTEECIKACVECHHVCLEMAMTHCLPLGGKHTEPDHFRLMMNCAEICQTSANFMLSGSDLHHLTEEQFTELPLVIRGESKEVRYAGNGLVVIRYLPSIYSFTHNRCDLVPGSDALRLTAMRTFLEVLRAAGIRHAYEKEREIVEGAGAVGIAALLAGKVRANGPVLVLLSGRNIDMGLHRKIVCGEKIVERTA